MIAEHIYNSIIERAKKEERKKGSGVYYESHHILPKCLGGTDIKDNIVLLTGKEHYICHKLLIRMYPDNHSLRHAYWLMANKASSGTQEREYRVSAREYAEARELHAEAISQRQLGVPRPDVSKALKGKTAWNKGKKLTKEQLAKHATHQLGYEPWNKGKKCGPQSEETKAKRSAALKGRKRSPEVIAKIKAGHAKRKAAKADPEGE